jgi:hypothetical protein
LTTLRTFDIPANTLVKVGDCLEIEAQIEFVSTGAATRTARLSIGGVTNVIQLASSLVGVLMHFQVQVYKTGPNTQKMFWGYFTNTLSNSTIATGASFRNRLNTALPDNAAIAVAAQGQCSAAGVSAGAVVLRALRAHKIAAP